MNASALVPVTVAVVPILIIIGLIKAVRYAESLRQRRDPFTNEFLRPPGHSLQRQVDALQVDVALSFGFGLAIPLWFYSVWLTGAQELAAADGPSLIDWLYGTLGLAAFLYFLVRVVRNHKALRRLRLGVTGEVATARELDRLMRNGCRVYHDIPASEFNVDHVVIGPMGVLAVETKARPKPDRGRGVEDATVRFDGRRIAFPDEADESTVSQARDRAKWLAEWLCNAVGEQIPVRPVLALPGWLVERQGLSDVMVVNPRETARMIQGQPAISEQLQERIAFQVERICRDERLQKRRVPI